MRSFFSYTKVQKFISKCIRGKTLFISDKKLRDKEYLDVGCGPNIHKNFVNLEYDWTPGIDVCWDITKKPYPFPDNRFAGIYSEHCFEHIPLQSFGENMKEFYRILKPNGVLRIIVPDGELYLDIYQRKKNGENVQMPYEENYISPMARINGIFRNHGHQFIYDFDTMQKILEKTGFREIKKCSFMKGRDANLLHDTPYREIESLYVEAIK